MQIETSSNLYGVTVNPYNRTLTPGGSSGGEGALLGFRGSCLGVGSDIGAPSFSGLIPSDIFIIYRRQHPCPSSQQRPVWIASHYPPHPTVGGCCATSRLRVCRARNRPVEYKPRWYQIIHEDCSCCETLDGRS